MSGTSWLLASLYFFVSASIYWMFLATLAFFTLACAWIRSDALFFFVIEVWENSPIMLLLKMVKYQLKVIVRHPHYPKRYLLLVIETLEVTGTVNRKKVTGTVTIFGADAPPLLGNTERLGSIRQTIRRTLN